MYSRTLPVSPWTSANLLKFCDGNEPWSIRCARWDGEEEEPEQHQSLRRAGGRAGDLMSTGERARQDAQGRILLQSRSGILPSGPAPHPGGREWVPICSSARIQSPDARGASLRGYARLFQPPLYLGTARSQWSGLAWALE